MRMRIVSRVGAAALLFSVTAVVQAFEPRKETLALSPAKDAPSGVMVAYPDKTFVQNVYATPMAHPVLKTPNLNPQQGFGK